MLQWDWLALDARVSVPLRSPRTCVRGQSGYALHVPRGWRPGFVNSPWASRERIRCPSRDCDTTPQGSGVGISPGLRPGSVVSHRAYQLYVHITWHTWKRVGCLNQAAAADVRCAVSSASRSLAVRVLRGAVLTDHVHLVVSFRPDTRLSDFVRLAKSVAAVRANRRTPGAVRWARGFYAATLHKRDLTRVIHYVAHQFERHPDRIPPAPHRPN